MHDSTRKTRKRKWVADAGDVAKTKKTKTTVRGQKKGPWAAKVDKVNGVQAEKSKGKARTNKTAQSEELGSDGTEDVGSVDDLDLRANEEPQSSDEEDETETPAQKRLRLAKLYLESVREELAEADYDAGDIDRELISARLRQDVLEHSGKVYLFVADSYDFTSLTSWLRCKGHRLSVTSATASEDLGWLFTAGKEGHIIKWDLHTGQRISTFFKKRSDSKGKGKEKASIELEGHTDDVLALAVSSDGRYLASGGKDQKICVWDPTQDRWIKTFVGHKDAISSLAFRKGTKQLYSASFDRTVKLHDLAVMGYVETLFGHQDAIVSLDALRSETAVTAGARDRTVRFWKIPEESQLVFRGGGKSAIRELLDGGAFEGHEDAGDDPKPQSRFIEGSIECVALIDETTFVSGGDTGSICLWTTSKKKPICTQPVCHGFHEMQSSTEGTVRMPRWITALASLRYSDVFVSGSWDGSIRVWKLDPKLRSFACVGTVPAAGVVNTLQLLATPRGALDRAVWANSPQAPSPPPPQHLLPQHVRPRDMTVTTTGVEGILVVAGLGQEHRLGRWLSVKEGVVNSTVVMLFRPRTR